MDSQTLSVKLDQLNPISLGYLDTPIAPMKRLSGNLGGCDLWIKRDDQTGLATGGNKVRKLNYVLADAQRKSPDMVMTNGGQQSNQARQTAAACAALGLPCTLVLSGDEPISTPQGNYLIDRLVGAEVIWAGEKSVVESLQEEADTFRSQGKKPYVVPLGASSALGVCGYVQAMVEVLAQMEEQGIEFDRMVVASGSGGTQAGMVLGARLLGYSGKITGISIMAEADILRPIIADLANEAAEILGSELRISEDELFIEDAYLGEGYGIVSEGEKQAVLLTARMEGILLDPVYTGRAMNGLIDMMSKCVVGVEERVLFWHTGGVAAIFHHAETLVG
jgi:L-cysteate sulfo-lyase